MKESRFVVNINRVLNVIFASGLLDLWLAVLPNGTAFPPLRGTQAPNFMKIILNKIHPILISYIPHTNRRERDHWGDLGVDGWIIL